MKSILVAVMCLASFQSFAATNCEKTAVDAAIAVEFPKGIKKGISVDFNVNSVKVTGTKITYKIEILSSYNDGASSDEFPGSLYTVTAQGTEKSCKITKVELN